MTLWIARVRVRNPEPARADRDGSGGDADRHLAGDLVRAGVDDRDRVPTHRRRPTRTALPQREHRDRHGSRDNTDHRRTRIHPSPLSPQLDIERPERSELTRQTVDQELVDALRLVEILQPPLTQIADRHAGGQVLLGEFLRRRGEQHLPAVRGRTDPRSAMHADADIALVAACGSPLCKPIRTRTSAPARATRARTRSRCASIAADTRLTGRPKRDEQRIALRVHHPTAVRRERGAQHPGRAPPAALALIAAEPLQQPVDPSMSVNRKVTVPLGSSATAALLSRRERSEPRLPSTLLLVDPAIQS